MHSVGIAPTVTRHHEWFARRFGGHTDRTTPDQRAGDQNPCGAELGPLRFRFATECRRLVRGPSTNGYNREKMPALLDSLPPAAIRDRRLVN
jgi:hypothetical protein